MKKIIILMMLLFVSFSAIDFAEVPNARSEIRVFVDGKRVSWTDALPFFDTNNRTMIPLSAVAGLLGAEASWDDKTSSAVVKLGDMKVELPIGKSYGLINGTRFTFDTVTVAKNGRTYVPLAFLSQSLGFEVRYIFGKDARTDYEYAHIIDVHTSSLTPIKPMIERDAANPYFTAEEVARMRAYYRTIFPIVMENDIWMHGQDGVLVHLKYMAEYELVAVNYTILAHGWEEFLINSIPLMIGEDGILIANEIIKSFKSVYNEETNIYEISKFTNINKTIKSGKFSYSYDTHNITWDE